MNSQEAQQTLFHQVEILETLEARFARLLHDGKLSNWPAVDIRDAIQLSAQHKFMAMQAINNQRLDQALNNIETVICIIGGFVEDEEVVDRSTMN